MNKLRTFVAIGMMLLSPSVMAHPHAFINMQLKPLVEEQRLLGFSMKWTLDEASSSELLYDLQLAQGDKREETKLIGELMKNVINEHYFSYFFDKSGNKIKYSAHPRNYGVRNVHGRAMYYFDFLLTNPQPLQNTELTLLTYDPSYYVAMSYDTKSKTAVDFSPLPANCRGAVEDPNVNAQIRDYAASLDRMQKDEDFTLGEQFAQRVVISCR
ncbi:DUF1007 family protein [Pasteurellaceae bacterium LIM206]|nr:DUF1007 family protein [Pasteurellaceae bacterium LIM206]